MDYFINTRLLGNPLNWLSIGAMLLIVAAGTIAIKTRLHQAKTVVSSDDGTTINVQSET